MKKETTLICLFLLGLLVLFLILNFISPLLLWDENVYLGNARSHLTISNFTEDFRFPLTEYIISFIWLLTGESIFFARLAIILLTIFSALLLYLIGKRYFSKKISFFLALAFSLSPLIVFWGFRAYADIPAMFFTILDFYFLLKNEEQNKKLDKKNRKKYLFVALAGISLALAFLARFPLALFALCAGLYFIIKKRPKELLLFALFFLLAISPWLIYNQITYKNPIWDFIQQFSVVQQWTSIEPVSKQLLNLVYAIGLLILPLILGIFSFLKKDKNEENKENKKPLKFIIPIYILISFVYYLFFVKLKDSRYYLAFLPFLFLVAFEGIVFIKNKIKNKNIMKIATILFVLNSIVLLIGSIYLIESQGHCDRQGALLQSISYLKPTLKENDIIVSNCWPWFGYYLNSRVYSPWTDITSFTNEYNVTKIITCSWFDPPYNSKDLDSLVLEKEFNGSCAHQVKIYNTNLSS